MSDSLVDTLNELGADRDTVQQALRLLLAEQTGDLTPKEMLAELESRADPAEIQQLLKQLQADPDALNQAALIALDGAWSDPAARPALRNALVHAKSQLPVIEIGIVAAVAMYGMYLATTKGETKTVSKRTRQDGNKKWSEEVVREREPFLPILSAFTKILRGSNTGEKPKP
jgi:hypothetical protein